MILKALFSSNTRVKILRIFLATPDQDHFIRELTRLLDEQINSIRRELENLKKIGLLKTRTRNRKKYYMVNKDFVIFPELKSLFSKAQNASRDLKKEIAGLGEIDIAVLSGALIEKPEKKLDLFLVGTVDNARLEEYISSALDSGKVRCMVMSTADYRDRLEYKDAFLREIMNDPENVILINKLKKA